jgi:hypothetical protein
MPDGRKSRPRTVPPRASDPDATHEETTAPLSPTRAFVVQFRAKAGGLSGRVEHLATGEAAFFENQGELLEFFDQILCRSAGAPKK